MAQADRSESRAPVRGFDGVTLVPVGGEGPEDVLVDEEGRVYCGVADGRIVRVAVPGGPAEVVARIPGRPLGLEFLGPDELLVCASDAGLLAVSLRDGGVRTLVDHVDGRPLGAVNNAAVAGDGSIYFTDSSTQFAVPQWRTDLVRGTRSGRLLRRAPDGTVTELLGGLSFANGVALAADGSYVAVAETGGCRLYRVWLTGEQAGRSEVFVDGLRGFPDNIARGSDGLIWVALPSTRTASLRQVEKLPAGARAAISRVPDRLQPGSGKTVSVLAVDDDGRIVHEYRGRIPGFQMLTAVRERDGRLWFGSLSGSSVATMLP
jgi:sugar lactone lactonase YvrE